MSFSGASQGFINLWAAVKFVCKYHISRHHFRIFKIFDNHLKQINGEY